MQRLARSRSALVSFVVVAVAGLGFALVGGASPAASATTKTVNIVEFGFSPATITVNVGDTVKWAHDPSTVPHSVTADGGSFDSSPSCSFSNEGACLGANATFSHTFTAAGTFPYYCRIHGAPGGMGMAGVVIVKSTTTSHPTLTSVTPTSVRHGTTSATLKIVGSKFATGVKVKISGTGVTVKSVQRVDAAHLTVTVAVASTAAKTKRSVTVTNPDGGTVTKTAALTVT